MTLLKVADEARRRGLKVADLRNRLINMGVMLVRDENRHLHAYRKDIDAAVARMARSTGAKELYRRKVYSNAVVLVELLEEMIEDEHMIPNPKWISTRLGVSNSVMDKYILHGMRYEANMVKRTGRYNYVIFPEDILEWLQTHPKSPLNEFAPE